MDQTYYILDTAIDRLNITFVRIGNCISDTEIHCRILPLLRTVLTNQEEQRKKRLLC